MLLLFIVILAISLLIIIIGIANESETGIYYLLLFLGIVTVLILAYLGLKSNENQKYVITLKCPCCSYENATDENTFDYDWPVEKNKKAEKEE